MNSRKRKREEEDEAAVAIKVESDATSPVGDWDEQGPLRRDWLDRTAYVYKICSSLLTI